MTNNTFETFLQVYYGCLGNCTYDVSYEQAESKWVKIHGRRKYKNYNVFKNALSRFVKRRKEQLVES